MQKLKYWWDTFCVFMDTLGALCDKELVEEERRREEMFEQLRIDRPGGKSIM